MKSYSLLPCLTFILLAAFSLSAQTSSVANKTGAASAISYFESVDTLHYEPVLGEDGKTYLNAQEAAFSGITSWEKTDALRYNKVEIEQPGIAWIEFMEINGMQAGTMNQQEGYQDQSNYIFDLFAAGSNDLFMNAVQTQESCEMKWEIWIDFNENHKFEEEERVFVGAGSQQEIQLQLPNIGQREFITRMRIAWAPQKASSKSDFLMVGGVKDVSVYIQ